MGKIGDLWVKLGLKGSEFKQGLQDAEKQTEGFNGKIKSLKAGAVAAFAAISAAIAKFAKDAMEKTQTWGDKWNQIMTGAQEAYGVFIRQISSGEGWRDLFANMADAYAKGKEIAAVLDEVFERNISFAYQEAETRRFISEQQLIMRDRSKSDAERKAAAQAIIDAEKELLVVKKDIARQEAKAQRDRFKLQTGITNDDDIDSLVKFYNINRDGLNAAREYATRKKLLQESLNSLLNQPQTQSTRDSFKYYKEQLEILEQTTSAEIKKYAILVSQYDKGNDLLVKNMADAEIAIINAETQANNSLQRANTMLGSFISQTDKATTATEDLGTALKELGDPLPKLAAVIAPAQVASTGNGLAGSQARANDLAQKAKEQAEYWQMMQDAAQELAMTIQDSLVGAFDELANAIAGVEGSNMNSIATALLRPIADMSIKLGLMVMASGEAIENLKKSLVKLGGAGAIAAGAGLVAIGIAAKAGIAALARGANAGSNAVSSGESASSLSKETGNMEMTIHIEGKLRGSDIVLAAQKTQTAWAR